MKYYVLSEEQIKNIPKGISNTIKDLAILIPSKKMEVANDIKNLYRIIEDNYSIFENQDIPVDYRTNVDGYTDYGDDYVEILNLFDKNKYTLFLNDKMFTFEHNRSDDDFATLNLDVEFRYLTEVIRESLNEEDIMFINNLKK